MQQKVQPQMISYHAFFWNSSKNRCLFFKKLFKISKNVTVPRSYHKLIVELPVLLVVGFPECREKGESPISSWIFLLSVRWEHSYFNGFLSRISPSTKKRSLTFLRACIFPGYIPCIAYFHHACQRMNASIYGKQKVL